MQGVMADVKEKVQNAAAKVQQKLGSAQASATEKTERVIADDEVGKEEAHARKHEKEGEAHRLNEQRKAENRAQKLQDKQDAHDRTMQKAHLPNATHESTFPTESNPYVQAPVPTKPSTIAHPNLNHEKLVTGVLPPDHRMQQPTDGSGLGKVGEDTQIHPEAFQGTFPQPQRPNANQGRNSGPPTDSNPYVQTPAATTTANHRTHGKDTTNAVVPADEPYQDANSVLPPNPETGQPRDNSGLGNHWEHPQTQPDAFRENYPQPQQPTSANPDDLPHQDRKSVFGQQLSQ